VGVLFNEECGRMSLMCMNVCACSSGELKRSVAGIGEARESLRSDPRNVIAVK
jgi:hypothetical protein